MKTIAVPSASILLALALVGCGAQQASNQATPEATPAPAADVAGVDETNAVTTDANGTRVTLFVTEDGFVPARVEVPAGKPVTLVVTRKTDKTCATELVMKEQGIRQKLPMNQAVEITFTPEKAGDLNYACGMDMIKGVIAVH